MIDNQVFKRIISGIKYRENISQRDLAAFLGLKPTYLSDMINRRVPITNNVLKRIYELYPYIDESEIIREEFVVHGNAVNGDNNTTNQSNGNTTNNYYSSCLPCNTKNDTTEEKENPLNDRNSLKYYYELSATASNIENILDNEINQPYTLINFPGYEGCIGFNVAGESMYPTMKERDIVAIKPEKIEFIVNGEIYLVVTRDRQRMIKRLCVLSETEEDGLKIKCISDNPNQELYAPFTIYGKDVHNIFRVKGAISSSLFE